MNRSEPKSVAVAGLGAVGKTVVTALDRGIPGWSLAAVATAHPDHHQEYLASLTSRPAGVPLGQLVNSADIVVEAAPAAILHAIVEPMVRAGKSAIVLSVAALLDHWNLVETAKQTGGTILVPTGALIGLDAVQAAAEGVIHEVRMVTRKPPRSLIGAPYIASLGLDIADIDEPVLIFSGTAREAARGFPANLNVAVALALAGAGPDATQLEIWADPRSGRRQDRL